MGGGGYATQARRVASSGVFWGVLVCLRDNCRATRPTRLSRTAMAGQAHNQRKTDQAVKSSRDNKVTQIFNPLADRGSVRCRCIRCEHNSVRLEKRRTHRCLSTEGLALSGQAAKPEVLQFIFLKSDFKTNSNHTPKCVPDLRLNEEQKAY